MKTITPLSMRLVSKLMEDIKKTDMPMLRLQILKRESRTISRLGRPTKPDNQTHMPERYLENGKPLMIW